MMPRISIITCVFNTKVEYLQDYIDSIMKQTYQDFEVIIVDDGSEDQETKEFLRRVKNENQEKIYVFFRNTNRGISASRNYALNKARGEYICVIDSDDYYEIDFLEKMVKPIEQGKRADMIMCSGYTCINDKKKLCHIAGFKGKNYDDYFYFSMPTGTRLIKRKLLTDNHIFFPVGTIYEDNAFCIAATLYSERIYHVEGYGYVNRQHGKSYSHGNLYKTITIRQIPYAYIKKHIFTNKGLENIDYKKRSAAQGAIMSIIATSVCFFCRESKRDQVKEIVSYSGKFVRKYIKQYYKYMRLWCKNCGYGELEKMLNGGFGLAILVHCESIYVFIVHKLLNFADKYVKNRSVE